MKKIIILIVIIFPVVAYSQFKFQNDSNFECPYLEYNKDLKIDKTIDKTLCFELRLWISPSFEEPELLRLTYSETEVWNAEKYLFNDNKINISKVQLPENWKEKWDSLIGNNILTLPDNPSYSQHLIAKEGELPIIEVSITDGTGYTVELYTKENRRKYYFNNPIGYSSFYTHSKPLKDFNAILRILSGIYNIKFK